MSETVTQDEVLDVLRLLRNRIGTPEKWCQNKFIKYDDPYRDPDPYNIAVAPVCLIGGVNAVMGRPISTVWGARDDLTLAVLEALVAGAKSVTPGSVYAKGKSIYDLMSWNDAKGRKHSQVIAAVDEAMQAVKEGKVVQ